MITEPSLCNIWDSASSNSFSEVGDHVNQLLIQLQAPALDSFRPTLQEKKQNILNLLQKAFYGLKKNFNHLIITLPLISRILHVLL